MTFRGVIPPTITFFDNQGRIDEARLQAHVEWLLEAGVHGLLGVGTCGEFSALDIEERQRVAERLVHAAGDTPVYIGVMDTSTRTAIRLAQHAQDIGASGVVSVAPYYSCPPEREVLTYFRDIADAVDIPLVVYNNPSASGVSLSVAALAALTHEGTAAAIKESHGDPARIHDLRLLCASGTALIYGEDYGSLEALLAGADAWTAGVANFMPKQAMRLWELSSMGDVALAREHWFRILPLINMTSHKPMFGRPDERPDYVQIYKAALDLFGRPAGDCRRPLLPLTGDDRYYLKDLLDALKLTAATA
ncbi:MAG TPA: dihydrodipicolinate synthase family protein [Jiangellaceae bacterium]|nr:dihydrodipicolinate synthase family protein [Jiangellaceae bacterium]